jgi:glycine cleavage system H protein
VVFVELPEVGRALTKGESFASVESVKAVSDIYAPVSGKISKINDKLSANPELINSSPFDDAWIIEIESANTAELSELMDQSQYDGYLKEISK